MKSQLDSVTTPVVHETQVRKAPRVVFGIMSAVARPDTVAQLTRQLAPHQVVIHHDFTQQPDFRIEQQHVSFVAKPRRTGYNTWRWVAGVMRLMQVCLDRTDCDYFQLLSPSCLAVRPVHEFVRHVGSGDYDAHAEFMSLGEPQVLMEFAHRALAPQQSLRRWLLRRARNWWVDPGAPCLGRAGLCVSSTRTNRHGALTPSALLALGVTRLIGQPWLATRPPLANRRLYFGGAWFGASREVCQYILEAGRDSRWRQYCRRVNDNGELVFATLLGNSRFRIGPQNHYVSRYEGFHPRVLTLDDLPPIAASGRFFARKFSDDPKDDIRRFMLEQYDATGYAAAGMSDLAAVRLGPALPVIQANAGLPAVSGSPGVYAPGVPPRISNSMPMSQTP